MKSFSAAVSACLATATLLGFALATPQGAQNVPNSGPKTLHLKFEWVQSSPKASDTMVISVDDNALASVTRPMTIERGIRSVSVQPTLLDNKRVALDLEVMGMGGKVERLKTRVTLDLDETKVISAISSKSSERDNNEEMLFVTPSL